MSFKKSSLFKQTNSFRMTLIQKLTYLNRMKANLLCWEWALPFSPSAPLTESAPRAVGQGSSEALGVRWETHTSFGVSAHGEQRAPESTPPLPAVGDTQMGLRLRGFPGVCEL